jgi:hypothetical protein
MDQAPEMSDIRRKCVGGSHEVWRRIADPIVFDLEILAALFDTTADRFVLCSMLGLVVLGTVAHGSAASA